MGYCLLQFFEANGVGFYIILVNIIILDDEVEQAIHNWNVGTHPGG
jgi:hypothetical protein